MGWPMAIAAAFTLLGAHEQSVAAQNAANSQITAISQTTQAQMQELSRQEIDVNSKAAEEKSDRIRAAERELAALRVASAEGFAMGDRVAGEIGFFEGTDLSRIEGSRANAIGKLQADQKALHTSAKSQISALKQQAKDAKKSAYVGALGNIAQMGAASYAAGAGAKAGAAQSAGYSSGLGSGLKIGGGTGLKGSW